MVSATLSRLAAPLTCLFALILLLPISAEAQEAPRLLSYQGQLLEDETTPVEGAQEVTFRLYRSPTGSATVGTWVETRTVEPVNGVFSVLLGNTDDLPDDLTSDADLYLGVSVNGTEIDRVRLTSTVFALSAARAGLADEVAADAAVTSLRGRTGEVGLSPGTGIRFEEEGNTIRIIATGGSDEIDSGVTSITAGAGLGASDGVGDVELFVDEITAGLLGTAAVVSDKLADGAVTANKLAGGAAVLSLNDVRGNIQLTGGDDVEIVRNGNQFIISIDTPQGVLTEVAVDGTTIVGNGADAPLRVGTIGSDQVATDAITSDKLADGAVSGGALQDDTAVRSLQAAGELLTDAVTLAGDGIRFAIDGQTLTFSLRSGAVTERVLADGAVTTTKLAADAAVVRLNSLAGDLTLRATGGAEISEDPEDGTITINAGSGGGTAGVTSIDARGGLEADPETGDVVLRILDAGITTLKLADRAVTARTLANEAVVGRTIEDGAITGVKVASGAIARTNIANNAINTAKLADGAVTGVKIDNETLESGNIASGAITTRTLADGAVTASKLDAAAVVTSIRGFTGDVNLTSGTGIAIEEDTASNIIRIVATGGGDDIESGVTSITAGAGLNSNQATGDIELEVSTITETLLGSNAVTTPKLADQAVTNAKLASNAVSSVNIQDQAVGSSKIAGSAVTSTQLAANAVETGNIVNQAVSSAKLANGAVTSGKLSNNTVVRGLNGIQDEVTLSEGSNITITPDEGARTLTISAPDVGLSDVITEAPISGNGTSESPVILELGGVTDGFIALNAVTTSKIVSGAVTNSKLSSNAVREPNVEDGAITTPKIALGAVGTDQLDTEAVTTSNIGTGQVTANKLAANAAVLSLNTLTGPLTLQGGDGVTVTSGSSTLTVDVDFPEGGLTEVQTDGTTIEGNGVDVPLSVGTIGSGQIAVNAITSNELNNAAVETANIAAGAVTGAQLADGAVNTAQLAAGAVATGNIGDGAVTGAKAAGTFLSGGLNIDVSRNGDGNFVVAAPGVLTSVSVDGSTIVGDGEGTPLSVGTVAAGQLANDAAVLGLGIQGAAQLTDDITLIGTSDVTLTQDDAARTITIDVNAPDGGLTSVATDGTTILGDGTDGNELTVGTIGSPQIGVDAITNAELGPNAVQTANIASGAVDNDALGAAAVNTVNIATGAVGSDQLANDAAVLGLGIQGAAQLTDDITLIGTSDVTLTQDDAARTITIDVNAPDGGLTSVATDATIDGDGTSGSPLSLADGAVATTNIGDGAVTGAKAAAGFLSGGSNISVTRTGGNFEVAAPNVLTSVNTDGATITGNGDDLALSVGTITSSELAADAAVLGLSANGGAALTGDVNFIGGTNVTLSQSGQDITIAASGSGGTAGVETLNGLDGALSLSSGNGSIGISTSGTTIDLQVASSSISSTELSAGAVENANLAIDAVQAANIVNGAVTTAKIGLAQVTADEIAADAVGTDELASGTAVRQISVDDGGSTTTLSDDVIFDAAGDASIAVSGNTITFSATAGSGTAGVETLNGLSGALSLVGDGIIEVGLSDPNINLSIADNTVTETQLATGAVQTDELANGTAVRSLQYQNNGGTLSTVFQDGVVLNAGTNLTFSDDGLDTITLNVDAVEATVLTDATLVGDGTSGSELGIADNGVGNLQLANDAVQAANLATGAVGTGALADDAVTDSKIADGAITSLKIGTDQVTTTELAVDAVQEVNIATGAVTADKLSADAAVLSISDGTTTSDGNLTFNSTDSSVDITVGAGTVDFTTVSGSTSAARYKEAVEKLENPAELLAQLRGVRYQWIEDGRADVGMIADEVAEVLPELVTFNDAGEPERLHYARLVAVLVEAAKEQQATVTEQQEQIDEMEARIARLERMVTQMAEAGN